MSAAVSCSTMSTGTMSPEEKERREKRKLSYHLLGTKNQLPKDLDDQDPLFRYLTTLTLPTPNQTRVLTAKRVFLNALAHADGDGTNDNVQNVLDELTRCYEPDAFDARAKPSRTAMMSSPQLEGMWISLIKPKFRDDLGMNAKGEYLYTLGRLSFGMCNPGDLVCSLQGTFNPVQLARSRDRKAALKRAPKSLVEAIQDQNTALRTYNVVTAFTIEPRENNKDPASPNANVDHPIEGLMTTCGFVVPQPDNPNRLSIFFTSGSLEVSNDLNGWKQVFTEQARTPPPPSKEPMKRNRSLTNLFSMIKDHKKKQDKTNPAADLVPCPMEPDGKMSYQLDKPMEGQIVDILYLDDTLRILRGSRGDLHVEARVPKDDCM